MAGPPAISILLVTPTLPGSGNHTTIGRIASHLSSHYSVKVTCLNAISEFEECKPQAIIAIHAYKCAGILSLLDEDTKLVTIFGGTDLSIYSRDPDAYDVMSDVVRRSHACVAFSVWMKTEANRLWPLEAEKVQVISQSVSTSVNQSFDFRGYLSHTRGIRCERIALLVAGIRAAKDPAYTLKSFAQSFTNSDTYLVVVGPVLEVDYGKEFVELLKELQCPNIVYIGALELPQAQAAIRQSDCLVNSSATEGMSTAIIEAFNLGTPVIARRNEGNASIVHSYQNGLLYNTPEEFVECLSAVFNDSELRNRLVTNAKRSCTARFSAEEERRSYLKLVASLFG